MDYFYVVVAAQHVVLKIVNLLQPLGIVDLLHHLELVFQSLQMEADIAVLALDLLYLTVQFLEALKADGDHLDLLLKLLCLNNEIR